DDLAVLRFPLNPDNRKTFLYRGNEGCTRASKRIEDGATRWGDQPAQVAHQLDRLHRGMVIIDLPAHRPLRPRSLGDIEKAACAAGVGVPHNYIILSRKRTIS